MNKEMPDEMSRRMREKLYQDEGLPEEGAEEDAGLNARLGRTANNGLGKDQINLRQLCRLMVQTCSGGFKARSNDAAKIVAIFSNNIESCRCSEINNNERAAELLECCDGIAAAVASDLFGILIANF